MRTDGTRLRATDSLADAGLWDGDTLSAVVQLPQIIATGKAFALCCCGGVVAWGNPEYGGDCSSVKDLRNGDSFVQQLQASSFAFAAIISDGSVLTWGNPAAGGDCSAVADQLRGVQKIRGCVDAFLNRVQNKIRRSAEVLSVIKPQYKTAKLEIKASASSPGQKAQSDNGRDRSRSPNRLGKKDTLPAEGPAAPFSDKLFSLECGGNGNCGYNCLAAGLALEKGQTFDDIRDVLETRGRTVRNDLYKHMAKHGTEYASWFVPPTEKNETIDAGPTPTSWQDYLESTLREHRWIDGLSLQAASRRYGIQIIVIPLRGEEKDKPMAFGEAKTRSPIVLLLDSLEGHYTLAQLKSGRQWPKEWVNACQASVASPAFRGGGKSTCSADWRPAATPSRASVQSWRPAATPSVSNKRQPDCVNQQATKRRKHCPSLSEASGWRPATTPCTRSSDNGKLARASGSHNASVCAVSRRAKVPSLKTARSSASSSRAPPAPAGLQEKFVWECNLCQQVFRYANKRTLMDARRRHIAKEHSAHRDKVATCFNRRQTPQIAVASKQIPDAQRAWSCPKCGKGLAYMGKRALKISRDAHVMQCYKLTKKKLVRLHYKSPIWKSHHAQLVKDNAAKATQSTDRALEAYNSDSQNRAFRIPAKFSSGSSGRFCCGVCTIVFQKFKGKTGLQLHACPGSKGRNKVLASPSRKRTWIRCRRQKDFSAVKFFIDKWRLTKSELDLLEKRLQANKDVPPLSKHQWIRDLCADGDVEPNPGPCSTSCQNLQVITCNVGGTSNAWACARWVVDTRPPVVILQEHWLRPDKQADLARYLSRHGYRSWMVSSPSLQGIRSNYVIGGVAVLVRMDKSCHEVFRFSSVDGQAIMVQLAHLCLIGVYMAPNPADDCQLLPTIDEWVRSTSELEPVLVAGDFNKPPDASDRWTWLKGSGASLAVRNSEGQYEPTRWKGRRCIDWLWSSHPHMISQLDFVPVFFADHKAVTCQVKVDQQSVRTYRAVPTRRLLPPSDISPGAWKAACEAAWADVSIPPSSTTEQEWQWFCRVAEQAYDRAMTLCGVEPPTQRGTRPKGTDLQVTAIRPETFRLKQNASCHELKLRRLLGRVLEAMRLVEQDAPIPNILKKRIWHHPLVRNQGFHRIEDIQSWCHSELESFLRQEKIARLQKWRQHIRSDPKAAAKWVRREHHVPVTSVYEDTFEQGRPSSNNQKSLEAIRKFWEGIWHRQGPDLDRATQAWQQHMPAEPEQPWNDITPQELQIQAAQQRGKAPGPDGWSGDELSFWPAQAWIVFAALTNRWLNREETPNVWASVRQVHIQKPEAVLRSDGALHAKHLRPIAIQCILWRIIASSWTCRSDTRQWVQRWAHPSAQGGVAGRSVGQAIDILLQEFAKKDKVLVSLDYSKCFDHVDPKIGIRCLVHLGCPRQIAGPLSAIWLNQRRWLTYNGECLPEAQQVSSSLPQGDSLSPLTLIAIVSGLSAHIVHDEPEPHVLTTFLDDRNFIASSPAQAGRLFHNWKLLSDEVGLSEKLE